MKYEAVIGLEIHAELKTKTKMFCSCLNNPEEKIPNKNICPVCLGHPGTLPVINKEAVRKVLLVGLALHSEIPRYSKFDRKNYFYPDLPKGYQISQYDQPLCKGGELSLYLSQDKEEAQKKIKITRVHLEEDTGKLIHSPDKKYTLIDFNRAGVPLMELVTEPVITSGREARLFAQGLQLLLRTLRVSEADMEKGQMRYEVNISLRPIGEEKLGTKVEIKNLNSFRAVERAIEFEIQRQSEILERGEKIIQETRGWDSQKGITYSQRKKEEAQDYRYFPEPDLPPLHIWDEEKEEGLFDLEKLREELPELPWEQKEKMITDYNLSPVQANTLLLDNNLLNFWKKVIEILQEKKVFNNKISNLVSNYLISDVKGFVETEKIEWEKVKLSPVSFVQLMILLEKGKISSRVAKDILQEMIVRGGEAESIVRERGLEKVTAPEQLLPLIQEVIKENPKAVEDYKKGKENAIKFLVGQGMAKTKGSADPKVLEKLIQKILQESNSS